jgi:hypothetical protein
MTHASRPAVCAAALAFVIAAAPARSRPLAKEFLTPDEIAKIQDAPEVDKRVKIYLDAAALRLKSAEERLNGKESSPGDPLEFFTPEEMVDGYYRILRSIMYLLDEAVERPKEPERIAKALRNLKDRTERDLKSLQILKKVAEEKQKEELWNAVNQSLEIADGAHEGAETGLTQFKEKEKAKSKKGR